MHRLKTHLCLLLSIGMFCFGVKANEPSDEELEALEKKHLVYVEPQNAVVIHDEDEPHPMKPYKDRVNNWGFMLGIGYSQYQPKNYLPQFETDGGYSDWYGGPSTPNIELHLQPKKNMSFGSVGLDVAGFSYSALGTINGENLQLHFLQLGLVYNADRLFAKMPYVVPYAMAGIYTVFYDETQSGSSAYKGMAPVTGYLAAGLNFQLDWLDASSAAITYKETALKGFYFYTEIRSYLASSNADANFSGNFWDLGIRAEF